MVEMEVELVMDGGGEVVGLEVEWRWCWVGWLWVEEMIMVVKLVVNGGGGGRIKEGYGGIGGG